MAQQQPDSRPYRKGVGMMVLNKNNQIFMAQRSDCPDGEKSWQMPQGGIDDGESPQDAALRELWEETGIQSIDMIAESGEWLAYDLPPHLSLKLWGGQYKGQTQKWFLMRFTGSDSEIDLESHTPEFCQWRWTPLEDLPDLVIDFKRKSYLKIIQEFKSHIGNGLF